MAAANTSETTRNTTRPKEAGAASRQETRRRLLAAATVEFEAGSYQKATVSRIAERAGVTVQTLYLAWGSKRALLRGYMEAALAGRDDVPYAQVLPDLVEATFSGSGSDPTRIVQQIAHLHRNTGERAATGWKLYRDASAVDPEIAEDWLTLQLLRRRTFAGLAARIPEGSLAPGITYELAGETAWVIASPETYELFVRTAGHTLDEYETWVATALAATLLRPGHDAGRKGQRTLRP